MTRISHEANHLRVVLDRPDRRNTIDEDLLQELDCALTEAESDPNCRVFVLSAIGDDFCAGMAVDASYLDGAATESTPGGDVADDGTELPYWRLLSRFTTTGLLTVALVDGEVTAGGVGLVAACDMVLAGERAGFRLTEALFGMLPAMALPFIVRRTGQQRAFTSALLTQRYGAADAATIGLVDRLGPSADSLLRPLLVGSRRVDRATVLAIKGYRHQLYPVPEHLGSLASSAFRERIATAGVLSSMARLKSELGD